MMCDRDLASDALPDFEGASPPKAPFSPRTACLRCGSDLTSLPAAARFCKRCGIRLSPPDLPGAFHRSDAARGGNAANSLPAIFWRFWWWGGAPPAQESGAANRSCILLAYAKSMLGLGWRYEHAVGSRRNLDEATRCYWKAARLGDPLAVARLGQDDVNVPPMPAGAYASTPGEPTLPRPAIPPAFALVPPVD